MQGEYTEEDMMADAYGDVEHDTLPSVNEHVADEHEHDTLPSVNEHVADEHEHDTMEEEQDPQEDETVEDENEHVADEHEHDTIEEEQDPQEDETLEEEQDQHEDDDMEGSEYVSSDDEVNNEEIAYHELTDTEGSGEQYLDENLVPLWTASYDGDEDAVRRILMDDNVEIEQGHMGSTPLLAAVCQGNPEIVDLLLKAGADSTFQSEKLGKTCLTSAAYYGQSEITRILLLHESMKPPSMSSIHNNSTFVDTVRGDGASALTLAVSNNHMDIAQMLIENGADVNLRNLDTGETPLFDAVRERHAELVPFLLEHGADVKQPNFRGSTLLHEAVFREDTQLVQTLINAGGDINATQKNGKHPEMNRRITLKLNTKN
jgi:hypothetical protein